MSAASPRARQEGVIPSPAGAEPSAGPLSPSARGWDWGAPSQCPGCTENRTVVQSDWVGTGAGRGWRPFLPLSGEVSRALWGGGGGWT